MEELEKRISEIVRSTVKEFIKSLMNGEIRAFLEQKEGQRNGYYERDIGTRYGKIDDLRVPRDRDNEFQTTLFDCQRRLNSFQKRRFRIYQYRRLIISNFHCGPVMRLFDAEVWSVIREMRDKGIQDLCTIWRKT